jgi:uncharacterized protein (DUF1684 family)
MDGRGDVTGGLPAEFDLLDWKRRVFGMYGDVRASRNPRDAWQGWRAARDDLFANHAQSPLPAPDRAGFSELPYFPYRPDARVAAEVAAAAPEAYDIATSGEDEGSYRFTRFAVARFELGEQTRELELFWLEGYGGGLFLPFRDATSGQTTYGAGRYLLDTVKGADLGMEGDRLVLDFNFAYNPSCAYDPRWVCPLAPPQNRMDLAIEAGERYG